MTPRKHLLIGRRFGRYVVTGDAGVRGKGRLRYWECVCDCGKTKQVAQSSLLKGISQSCGCLSAELASARRKTHGRSRTTEHTVWLGMKQRCTDPNYPAYKHYGGRGISVCSRWDDFEMFLADMGPRPDGMTLDRYPDVNGNYEPGNCRWSTAKQQANNKRNNQVFQLHGKEMTVSEISDLTGVPYFRLHARLVRMNWPIERAITEPSRQHKSR